MTPNPSNETFEKRFRDLQLLYSRSKKRVFYVALTTTTLFIILTLGFLMKGKEGALDYELYFPPKTPLFVVDTPTCRIWNYQPFSEDVDLYKAQMNYSIDDHPGTCESLPLLTSVSRTKRGHVLHLHKKDFAEYKVHEENVTCCYSYIFSSALLFGEEENATVDEPKYTDCKIFNSDVELEPDFDFVRVTCGYKDSQQTPPSNVYKHFHSFVSIKREVKVKMDLYNETIRLGEKFKNETDVPHWEKPWSVVIVGLDSVSRLNLKRTMPKTVDYLDKNGWHDFEGYNKVGDTTFPNLAAAVMAGSTEEQLRKTCAPKEDSPVDWCPWVWGKFASQGYITAYGEDNTRADTFYNKAGGFRHPPTDYFLRTLLKAADDFTSWDWYEKFIQYYDCVGTKHESEYIFEFSLEFAEAFDFYPTFSLFWLNSFSHDRLFGPKPMDEYMKNHLHNLTNILNDTIVVFMSDHGMAHGFYRQTEMGFIENNMPFLYIWLPRSFQKLNPRAVANLKRNKHKLTSHFDLHMTLLDLLGDGSKAPGCPDCASLFRPIPANRTCAQAGVPLRYCACTKYTKENNVTHRPLAGFLVKKINELVLPFQNDTVEDFKCSNFTLKEITTVKRVLQNSAEGKTPRSAKEEIYLVTIKTEPYALFEAMIIKNDSMHVIDNILRLDPYEKDSRCLMNGTGRPYCVCEATIDVMKRIYDDEKATEDANNSEKISSVEVNETLKDSGPVFKSL